jgi:hypothetical protein
VVDEVGGEELVGDVQVPLLNISSITRRVSALFSSVDTAFLLSPKG